MKSKEVSRLSPASYRPVALLPVMSKLVERAVQTQLQEHMERHGLLNVNSHAYRQNLSTSTALMQVTDQLYSATDEKLNFPAPSSRSKLGLRLRLTSTPPQETRKVWMQCQDCGMDKELSQF